MKSENSEKRVQRIALNTYIKLVRATETATANIHRYLVEENLTISQFGVMEALFHLGPLSLSSLGRKILKSNANLTTVVDNLEKRNLVARERTHSDRRQIHVCLSPEGRRLIERIFPSHAMKITEEMCHLTVAELELLGSLCRKLGKREGPKISSETLPNI